MSKKLTYEEVYNIIESFGYILIDSIYLNNKSKMNIKDKDGYLYYTILDNLRNGHLPKKFGEYNPHTIHNIKLWCKLENKSFELIDNQEYTHSKNNLKWRCLKEECGEIFEAHWNNISHNHGCGFCDGKQVGISNCLATINPQLASEWHPTLNGNLTPCDVTANSSKKVWWQCSKNPKHEWFVSINDRWKKGCPYCSGKLPSKDYNLLICNPELCKEWDYTKNKKKPNEYCPNSGEYAWWKCQECNHEWEAVIANRNNGKRCPKCNESKGERKISKLLKFHNINYIPQKTFKSLMGLGGGNLSYDLYLPKYNLLIEYQGEYHEKKQKHVSKKKFERQLEHDKRKKEYAKNNNINLLEIWYWDFDNIEKILDNYFKEVI